MQRRPATTAVTPELWANLSFKSIKVLGARRWGPPASKSLHLTAVRGSGTLPLPPTAIRCSYLSLYGEKTGCPSLATAAAISGPRGQPRGRNRAERYVECDGVISLSGQRCRTFGPVRFGRRPAVRRRGRRVRDRPFRAVVSPCPGRSRLLLGPSVPKAGRKWPSRSVSDSNSVPCSGRMFR